MKVEKVFSFEESKTYSRERAHHRQGNERQR